MTKSKGVRAAYMNREIDWKNPEHRRAYKREWQRNARAQYNGKKDMVRAGEIADYKGLPPTPRIIIPRELGR